MTAGGWRTQLDPARRIQIGPVQVPVRGLLAIPGVVVWLAITGILAGFDNMFAALAANAGFIIGLFLIASLTRTVRAITVGRAFLLGGSAMAVMLLLGQPLTGLATDPSTTVDSVVEELLKLAPLGVLLWQGRRLGNWQLSATDIVLIAAASGAGFAVVEDAYIRMNEGWGDTVPFLPTTELYEDRIRGDRLICGHAIWTGLAGITIGLAWLMVRFRPVLLLAPLGFVVATADHIGVNSDMWPALGPLVIVLFVAGVIGAIALDLYVLTQKLPSVPELDHALAQAAEPVARWRRALETRRLRFAAWRLQRTPSSSEGGAERAIRHSVVLLLGNPSR